MHDGEEVSFRVDSDVLVEQRSGAAQAGQRDETPVVQIHLRVRRLLDDEVDDLHRQDLSEREGAKSHGATRRERECDVRVQLEGRGGRG